MKKNKRIIFTALLMGAIMWLLPFRAVAAGTVTYQGADKGFVFAPGSNQSPSDLFSNFKDVMPGDSLSDTVDIRNEGAGEVKIYLRALGATEESKGFLSQLNLQVEKTGGSALFDSLASEKGTLSDWVLLGTFKKGDTATLNLTLTVPLELDDAYQDAVGTIQWEFKAEEESERVVPVPNTGDSGTWITALGLFLVSGFALVCAKKAAKEN